MNADTIPSEQDGQGEWWVTVGLKLDSGLSTVKKTFKKKSNFKKS